MICFCIYSIVERWQKKIRKERFNNGRQTDSKCRRRGSWLRIHRLVTQPPSHGGTLLQSIQMIQKVLHSNNNSRHLFSDSLKIIFSTLISREQTESRQKAESTLVNFFSNVMQLTSRKYRQQEVSKKTKNKT